MLHVVSCCLAEHKGLVEARRRRPAPRVPAHAWRPAAHGDTRSLLQVLDATKAYKKLLTDKADVAGLPESGALCVLQRCGGPRQCGACGSRAALCPRRRAAA